MNIISRRYCTLRPNPILPYSTVKRISPDGVETPAQKVFINSKKKEIKVKPTSNSEYRENEVNIQMLSRSLHKQIFGQSSNCTPDPSNVERFKRDLNKHGVTLDDSPKLDDVIINLPNFRGNDIEEHFLNIAKEQSEPYKILIQSLLIDNIPDPPTTWCSSPGWTCYKSTEMVSVDFPNEDALIFDVEVCMSEGSAPTMACALGRQYWYSWTSPRLQSDVKPSKYTADEMIPIDGGRESAKIVVGHNVSYDRARIKEQYFLEGTGTRFLDTMSLHVCVSGITSYQRAMLKSKKEFADEDAFWSSQSSLNSLAEVYKLYCNDELSKEQRNVFVNGTLDDVRNDFQNLMTYCANDVRATQKVVTQLFPLFLERFSHPVTLAGMLELGNSYLPVSTNWLRYINESNLAFEDSDIEAKYLLAKRADQACRLMHGQQYKKDLWMWDQDWSTQEFKLKKTVTKKMKLSAEKLEEPANNNHFEDKFQYLYDTAVRLPARRQLLPGYPAWYRKLCLKRNEKDWLPGPQGIGTGMQVAPKLLSLTWEGYPLHYIRDQGWGFLMPHKSVRDDGCDGDIPLEQLVAKCPVMEVNCEASSGESQEALSNLWKDVESNLSKTDYYSKKKKRKIPNPYKGTGVWCNLDLENCCWFLKLPHKDGASHRVGNPLAKDFINKFSENVLSGDGPDAERVIEIAKMLSYWRNNRERIMGQMVVWLGDTNLPKNLHKHELNYGAIIPQVVVCGTLTRRAMEPTWMTASNAQRERVGSELRGMVQAPPGYKIVGADVDSQELWIASVLGDAYAAQLHGATPLGWMTLSGSKSSGTDMHSVTAKAVGISRDHAKVINYARIYGAGQNFAERLLKQFNPNITAGEAKSKAMKMFALTKGKKLYYLLQEYQNEYPNKGYSGYEALKLAASNGIPVNEMFQSAKWEGGTESAMFNRLEEIAGCPNPVTPFLNSRLSRALETQDSSADDRFLPTKINWVVQSGAVDFLHLMLICMRWLMGPHIRFCLSFHDEVRYLVKDNYAYKAALAMHCTNLLTRSFCAKRIGLNDLPQSVAFFTSVEVDTVLRKESHMDCKTPSNPHGLHAGYGIPEGESLDIQTTIKKAGGKNINQWAWHKSDTNA